MIGDTMRSDRRTRQTSSQPPTNGNSAALVARLSEKKTRMMLTICFHLGGVVGRFRITSKDGGSSNHPSIPVLRTTGDSSTSPCALPIHHARSADCSHTGMLSASANLKSMCHRGDWGFGRIQPDQRYPGLAARRSWPPEPRPRPLLRVLVTHCGSPRSVTGSEWDVM